MQEWTPGLALGRGGTAGGSFLPEEGNCPKQGPMERGVQISGERLCPWPGPLRAQSPPPRPQGVSRGLAGRRPGSWWLRSPVYSGPPWRSPLHRSGGLRSRGTQKPSASPAALESRWGHRRPRLASVCLSNKSHSTRSAVSALAGEAGGPVCSWLIREAVVWPVPSAFVRAGRGL